MLITFRFDARFQAMENKPESWMGVTAAAAAWGISSRRVRVLCEDGAIAGAEKPGRRWRIPADAPRPPDGRAMRGRDIRPVFAPLFREIDGLRGELARRRPLSAEEKRRLLDEFTVEYTHDSAAIEGNTLTLSETALVLQGVTIGEKPLKDHLEAIGHRDAFQYLCGRVADGELPDEWFIRDLLGRLAASRRHPIERAALFHILFEAVHPFVDGNGHTGRLLLNYLLMLDGYPPVNVKYADRRRYYDAFTSYHRDGDEAPMVLLVAEYVRVRLRQTLSLLGAGDE